MPGSDQGLMIPIEVIEGRIFILRGRRVMLDRYLADLYGVQVKRLNEQVKRNSERFPEDFMFQLTLDEGKAVLRSRSQIATLERGRNIKYRPYVFTEHGAVMLANVLRSPVAVRASIQVVCTCARCSRRTRTWPGRSKRWNVRWGNTMPTCRPFSECCNSSCNRRPRR